MRLAYPVRLDKRFDTMLVSFPDIPEALSEGANEEEALAEARDCLVAALGGYIRDWRPIPPPSRRSGMPEIALSELVATKIALYKAARAKGLNALGLALQLGCSRRVAQRLLDVDGRSRLNEVQAALLRLDHAQLDAHAV